MNKMTMKDMKDMKDCIIYNPSYNIYILQYVLS